MKRIILSIAALLFSGGSLAGSSEGTIDFIQAGSGYTPEGVYLLVKMNSTHVGMGGCITDDRFAINPATQPGKTIVSMLLAAQLAGKIVHVQGTGECDLMGSEFETISYIRLLN